MHHKFTAPAIYTDGHKVKCPDCRLVQIFTSGEVNIHLCREHPPIRRFTGRASHDIYRIAQQSCVISDHHHSAKWLEICAELAVEKSPLRSLTPARLASVWSTTASANKAFIARFLCKPVKLRRNGPFAAIWDAYSQTMCKNGGVLGGKMQEKWKRLWHWLCSSRQLLRGSQQRGCMHRHSPLMRSPLSQFQTPTAPRRVSRFFRVWLLSGLPRLADHSAYFGLAKFYLSQPFQPSTW